MFKKISESEYTVVFYESPHRLIKTLIQLKNYLSSDAKVVVAKELTKIYETFYRGNLNEVISMIPEKPKGEYAVMISS